MKNFKYKLITSALPYANGHLHIGHIRSTYLPADIHTRFLRDKGDKAFHVCGTDEHGTPILVSAIKSKKNPKEVVDFYHNEIKRELEHALIHFDIFSRTTKKIHYNIVQDFYSTARKEGYIYYKEVPILYCERDKLALPDRLVKGTCPYCGAPDQYGDHCEVCGRTYNAFQLKNPRCAVCGSRPVVRYSKHAFFELSKLSDRLEKWVKNEVKLTKGVKEHVLYWIREGLQDWDITRDINWGVPVPDLSDQVFYVWWDAPIGYVSFTKELFDCLGLDWRDVWIDDDGYIIHYIGKDIIYHHVLFWPAMLMVNGFSLPNEIRVRGFATLEGQKMSKSRGHVIDLEEFIRVWSPEYLRFYWGITTSESLDDGDFSLKEFQVKINKVLIGEIGNFINRVLKLIVRGNISKGKLEKGYIADLIKLKILYEKYMNENKFDEALSTLINIASVGNKLLSDREPWKNLGSEMSRNTLFTSHAIVIMISILMDPYFPKSSAKLREVIGITSNTSELYLNLNRIIQDEEFISSSLSRILKQKTRIKPLFAKVSDSDINKLRSKLRGGNL